MDSARVIEFVSNHWIMTSGLFIVTILLIQDLFESATRRYKSTSPTGAVALMNNEETLVIDVREPHEFSKGHIERARHIPLGRLDDRMFELEEHKNKPIIVVCQQGSRSADACKKLHAAGYSEVYDLSGGMLAWEDAKLPTTRKKS